MIERDVIYGGALLAENDAGPPHGLAVVCGVECAGILDG